MHRFQDTQGKFGGVSGHTFTMRARTVQALSGSFPGTQRTRFHASSSRRQTSGLGGPACEVGLPIDRFSAQARFQTGSNRWRAGFRCEAKSHLPFFSEKFGNSLWVDSSSSAPIHSVKTLWICSKVRAGTDQEQVSYYLDSLVNIGKNREDG